MRTLSVDEVADHLDEYVTGAQVGEPILVARDGRVVAALVSVEMLENLGVLLPRSWEDYEGTELEQALATYLRAGTGPRYDGS